MGIELGGLHLTKIHDVRTVEHSDYVCHRVPGLSGEVLQDAGRESVRLVIEGIFYGVEAEKELAQLRAIHTAHKPVDFVADITGANYVGKVLLDTFEVREFAGEPDQFSYVLYVSEYVEPKKTVAAKKAAALGAVGAKLKVEAKALKDIAALPSLLMLGTIPELSNPLEPLQGAMEPLKGAVTGFTGSVKGLVKLFGG